MVTKQIKVIQPEPPIAVEILATAIEEIAKGMRAINATRLERRVLVLLIRDRTSVRFTDIEAVLDAMDELESVYLKPKRMARQ